jgi:hypothetical protein
LKENRKGNFNKSHLSTEFFEKHREFKAVLIEKTSLKVSKGTLTKEELDSFSKRLEKINVEKEEIRMLSFEDIAKSISHDSFQFKIEYHPSKEVYTIENEAASYYAIKQLQRNIFKTFKVIQADRNLIIKQLFNILSDGFPKIVIKTDIKSFYESIPQDELFSKINDNNLLSPFSKKLIRNLFYEFETKKNTALIDPKKGVPRGIGLSAYLSELYMRDVDSEIKSLPDLIYYARYVDDIVIVFSPKTESTKGDYLKKIKKIITEKNKLPLKDGTDGEPTKTFELHLPCKGNYSVNIPFLGYSFNISRTEGLVHGVPKIDFKAILELSHNKIERYKNRLRLSVEAYNKDAPYNEKEARNLLFSRLKFLTGNFHLNNNKRNVKSGVYYSNQMLKLNTETYTSLKTLDKALSGAIKLITPPAKIGINKTNLILHIIKNYSFQKGFLKKEKHFFSFIFSPREAAFYISKFGRVTNKFEVIKSIWK